jgi:hypothetical protein
MLQHVGDDGFLEDRGEVEDYYMRLTSDMLPGMADPETWPITDDHCFMRVCLDNAFGDVWYGYVDDRPAYKSIEDSKLVKATSVAMHMYDYSPHAVRRLNERSLYWRDEIGPGELTYSEVSDL